MVSCSKIFMKVGDKIVSITEYITLIRTGLDRKFLNTFLCVYVKILTDPLETELNIFLSMLHYLIKMFIIFFFFLNPHLLTLTLFYKQGVSRKKFLIFCLFSTDLTQPFTPDISPTPDYIVFTGLPN